MVNIGHEKPLIWRITKIYAAKMGKRVRLKYIEKKFNN